MRPAIASGIVPGDALVSYWLFFSPVPCGSPRGHSESLTPLSFLVVSKVAIFYLKVHASNS